MEGRGFGGRRSCSGSKIWSGEFAAFASWNRSAGGKAKGFIAKEVRWKRSLGSEPRITGINELIRGSRDGGIDVVDADEGMDTCLKGHAKRHSTWC